LLIVSVMQLPNLEVWFQRPKDIVRKLQSGDLDLGFVGYDTVCEYGQVNLQRKLMQSATQLLAPTPN
jgi:ATP phosphoribosyltransferase